MTRKDRFVLGGVGLAGAGGTGLLTGAIAYALLPDAPVWLAVTTGFVGGSILGAGLTWLIARRWRSGEERSEMRAVQEAIDNRELPSDAIPEVWNDRLDNREKKTRRGLLFLPLLSALSAVYLVLGITRIVPDLGVWGWVGAAVPLLACIGIVIEVHLYRRRIALLRTQLHAAHAPAGEPPTI